jgi:hypothetical protein
MPEVMFNSDESLEKDCHSREGGNPDNRSISQQRGSKLWFCQLRRYFFLLDSRLRGKDEAYGLFMFKSALLGALSLLVFSGAIAGEGKLGADAQSAKAVPASESASHCAAILSDGGVLCALEGESGAIHWQINKPGMKTLKIGSTGGEGEYFSEFALDRHGRYIAIVTAAEGHPFLSIYSLRDWIKQRSQPKPLYLLDPYPGSFSLDGWDSPHHSDKNEVSGSALVFSTDGPVLSTDSHVMADVPVEHSYRIYLPSQRIERIK